ncbi:MAG: hypothetical protein SH821_18030 [Phototrophicales bacterium]|nr:hypothetical protein [Phototrophicales bacterium]
MADNEDKRGVFDEEVFTYDLTKAGLVLIYWHGKHVTTLSGKKAEKFVSQVESADDHEAQLVMARVTGNFKRGNEREGKE